MKLEEFILKQLYILGAVGIGIAFLQVKHSPLKKKSKFNTDLKVYSNTCALALSDHHIIDLCLCLFVFQLLGIVFTCCLYRNLEEDPY